MGPLYRGATIMRRAAGGFALLFLASVSAFGQKASTSDGADAGWSVSYNQEVRYSAWRGDRGTPADGALNRGSGAQLYSPFGVSVSGKPAEDLKLELNVAGGHVWSRQSTPGINGEISTMTDTVFSGTTTYTGLDGWQPFLTLSINTPTGTSVLKGSAANARMDSDLVDLGSFGGGLTIGPTVGVNVPLTADMLLSFGAGVTIPYKFDVEGAIDPNTLAQGTNSVASGRTTTFNASWGYQKDAINLQITGSYSISGESFNNGTVSFRPGAQFLVSANASYNWTPSSVTAVTGSWSFGQKNKVYDGGLEMLVYDEFNSNNAYYRARLEHAVDLDNWTVGPFVNWMLRNFNSYNPNTQQFVSAKTRWGLGGSVKYKVSDALLLNASIERIFVHEHENPEKPGGAAAIPALRYDALAIVIGGTVKF
jgi:hypothetical protein